jgi:hypothetical protein
MKASSVTYIGMTANVRKCRITGALLTKGDTLSLANRTLLASRLQQHFVTFNKLNSPLLTIDPSKAYRVLGVELIIALAF